MIHEVMRRNRQKLKDHKVFLFGSRAAGTARKRSDFDVGVYGEEPIPLQVLYDIETELEDLPTLYEIDWVDMNRASARFREQAMKKIEVLM